MCWVFCERWVFVAETGFQLLGFNLIPFVHRGRRGVGVGGWGGEGGGGCVGDVCTM